jgi:hypothetical protein
MEAAVVALPYWRVEVVVEESRLPWIIMGFLRWLLY